MKRLPGSARRVDKAYFPSGSQAPAYLALKLHLALYLVPKLQLGNPPGEAPASIPERILIMPGSRSQQTMEYWRYPVHGIIMG